jgi:hypothetical protein
MGKKCISVLLIMLITAGGLLCADTEESVQTSYTPYNESEFSQFALDMRRAETIFFGSLPITYAATSLVVASLQSLTDSTEDQVVLKLGITVGLSLSIAVLDYVIGIIQSNSHE